MNALPIAQVLTCISSDMIKFLASLSLVENIFELVVLHDFQAVALQIFEKLMHQLRNTYRPFSGLKVLVKYVFRNFLF